MSVKADETHQFFIVALQKRIEASFQLSTTGTTVNDGENYSVPSGSSVLNSVETPPPERQNRMTPENPWRRQRPRRTQPRRTLVQAQQRVPVRIVNVTDPRPGAKWRQHQWMMTYKTNHEGHKVFVNNSKMWCAAPG
jgi:hypothetical protein